MPRAPRRPSNSPAELRCAALDDLPVRYHRERQQAWASFDRLWSELPYTELFRAQLMLRRDFDQRFGALPAVPKGSFRDRD